MRQDEDGAGLVENHESWNVPMLGFYTAVMMGASLWILIGWTVWSLAQ